MKCTEWRLINCCTHQGPSGTLQEKARQVTLHVCQCHPEERDSGSSVFEREEVADEISDGAALIIVALEGSHRLLALVQHLYGARV